MVGSDANAEKELPQENTQSPAGDPPPDESEEGKSSVENGIKEILGKMPVKDKEELQRDYGTIQYINITYQGNHVENSGAIYGGITQQQGGSGSCSPDSAKSIQDFFRPNVQIVALAALLTLATFESVQESRFYEMISFLSEMLRQGKNSAESESADTLVYLQTVDELLSPLSIQREALPFTYGDAELNLQCLVFDDRQIPDQVRRWVWGMYPQLRSVLTDWLLHFQNNIASAADRALAYAATRGLAVYASLDVEYACHNIIPRLECNCTTQADVKFLSTFFRQFMQMENCQLVSDELLRRWCGKQNKFFWQVPYQLYSVKDEWRFCKDVPDILRNRLQQDYDGLHHLDSEWYGQNRGYFLYPAHENRSSAALLGKEISWCFSKCKTPLEQYQMAIYFLVLFRWDYLTDFSSAPELSFFRSFHDKETRNALLPVFAFIWRHVELRDTMRQVLECHFAEINTDIAFATYLEKPFEFLAFTGNRIDFQNTIKLLKDCTIRENAQPAAEYLIRHLNGVLWQRQGIE